MGMHITACEGHAEVVELLLQRGADAIIAGEIAMAARSLGRRPPPRHARCQPPPASRPPPLPTAPTRERKRGKREVKEYDRWGLHQGYFCLGKKQNRAKTFLFTKK
jgi:DNA-binding transcriptional LysR family regulator